MLWLYHCIYQRESMCSMPLTRADFLLDPDVVFLNHGSFGACPAEIFAVYQQWQRELERQPVEFLGRRLTGLLYEARERVAAYLNIHANNLFFVHNATVGINTVARSLALQPGDEILTTDHEYGAMDKLWQFICRKTGAHYISHPVPVGDEGAFIESLWGAVTPRTRVLFLSHLTSPTALIFPIAELCQRARSAGILTIIDGAHAPGQIALDVEAIGADIYTGNFHKWCCSPKSAAFLYVRPEHQEQIDPLVISWGWMPDGAGFIERHEWQGTQDPTAFLTVPAAIEFQERHDWASVRARCHIMAVEMRERLAALTRLPPLAPPEWFRQMIAAPLPPEIDPVVLKAQLYDQYWIEVPIGVWKGQNLIRVSFQVYNTPADADCLIEALRVLLKI